MAGEAGKGIIHPDANLHRAGQGHGGDVIEDLFSEAGGGHGWGVVVGETAGLEGYAAKGANCATS